MERSTGRRGSPGPGPCVAILAALALGCPAGPARREVERGAGGAVGRERISKRLLDHLDEARVTLPELQTPSSVTETAVLELRDGDAVGEEWISLLAPDAAGPRRAGGPSARVREVRCRAIPVVAGREHRLTARVALSEGAPGVFIEGGGPARVQGAVFAIELSGPGDPGDEPCSPWALGRYFREWRHGPPAAQADGTHRFDIAFTTTPETRFLAVILAPDVELRATPAPALVEHSGTELEVRELVVSAHQADGLFFEELRARFRPDPLLRSSAPGLRVAADLDERIRDALAAPPGTRVCWHAPLRPGAALRAAVGVGWDVSAHEAPAVDFVVEQGDRVLHEERVSPGERGWREVRVLLDASSEALPLCLVTRAEEHDGALWPFWGTPELTEPAEAEGRPRTVVVVSIDTLRADRLGLYGHALPTSPFIDDLGEESLVIERGVAQTGWTLPSHVSMLTGLAPGAHGLAFQDQHLIELFGVGFDPSIATLASVMREAGYSTHGVVSGPYVHPSFGFGRGFDSFDYSSIGPAEDCLRSAPAPRVTELSNELVDGAGDRPLFLFIHHWDVHFNYIPPTRDLRPVHPALATIPEPLRHIMHPFLRVDVDPSFYRLLLAASPQDGTRDAARRAIAALPRVPRAAALVMMMSALYDGEVRTVDRHLGMLFDHLRERGRWDDAVVVVTSDHGEGFLEHGVLGHPHAVHEEGLGIPIVIRAPGRVAPGRRAMAASNVDITPTMLDLLGLEPLPDVHGRSLLGDRPAARLVVGHDGVFDRVQAELWPHRLVVWRRFGEDELFDLEADPGRWNDVGEERPAERAALREALARYLLETGRGLHVAVSGSAERTPLSIELSSESYLGTVFAYGPPGSAELALDDGARRLLLEASPGPGELVGMTVLVPDDVPVDCLVERGGAPAPAVAVRGPDGATVDGCEDESLWREEREGLPEGLGAAPGRVHLWRTRAGTARLPVALPRDTLDQLRALGYIHDQPVDAGLHRPPGDGGPGR